MSERPRSPRLVVRLLLAFTVLGLVFGGGVLVGKAMRGRARPVTVTRDAPISAMKAKKELAVCRRKLSAHVNHWVTPPVSATPPQGEPADAGPETAANIDALHKDVDECKVRETLLKAQVCGTFGEHINLLFVLLHSSRCAEEAGLEEFLTHGLEKCAGFDDDPTNLDEDTLTKAQANWLVQSKWTREAAARNADYVTGHIKTLRRECRKTWALPDE